MANIIEGSGIGPASHVVTASDLNPVTVGNSMHKYGDDTYLVVPAAHVQSCAAEIANVEVWADVNNLKLNQVCGDRLRAAEEQTCPDSCRLRASRVDQAARHDHQP
jgi:hypothetical protein